jgi:RHS repeat-associated protein
MRFPPLQLLVLLLTLWGINLNGLTGNQVSLPSWGNTAPTVNPGTPSSATYDAKDLFYLQLYRDQRPTTNDGSAAPAARNNGDISFVATQVRGRDQMLFGIKYDEYDRMRDARFYERSSASATAIYATHYWETAAYDERGNITDLNRRGTYVNNNLYYEQGFDDLDYTYQANSNRLHSIDDATSNARGYHEQPGTYDYDDNGNTNYDPSRKITIAYNHIDLPTSIRWLSSGQQRIELTYDAAGTMLTRKRINSSDTTEEIRDYIGGIEYVDNALESVHHAEGRVYFGGSSTERYDYALTDHLGNTRLLYSDLNNNGVPEVPGEIIQEEHYYPFGMKMTGPWMGAAAGATTAYQYNGIEHVDDFDLNVNMAMYRTLDPVIGRWWSVDPKAEVLYGLNPYNAMNNSPMVFNDPNGDIAPLIVAGIMAIGGIANLASNWDNVSNFTEGASYFVNGAVSYGIATVNPVLGGVLLATSNLGLQAVNGDLPSINSLGDVLNVAVDVGFDFIGPYTAGLGFQTQFFNAGGSLSASEIASLAKQGVSISTTAAGGIGARQVAIQTVVGAGTATTATQAATRAATSNAIKNFIPRTKDALGHIFRNNKGHVNPSTK